MAGSDNLFRELTRQSLVVYTIYRVKPTGYGMIVAGLQEPFPSETLMLDARGAIEQKYSCGGPTNMLPQNADFLLPPKEKS